MSRRFVTKAVVARYHNNKSGLRRKISGLKHRQRELDKDLDYYCTIKDRVDGVTEVYDSKHPIEVYKVCTAHWTIHNPFSTKAHRMADVEKIGFEWRVKYHLHGCFKHTFYFDRLREAMASAKTFVACNNLKKGRKKQRRKRRCC